MALSATALAMYEAHLEEARRMAESPDAGIAAQGRAGRDISLALIRWHENEKTAGTEPMLLANALNATIAHALAGFASDHAPGADVANTLAWHLQEIARLAATAIAGASQ